MSTTYRPRPQQINLVDARLLRVRERLSSHTLLWIMGMGVLAVGLHYAIEKHALDRQLASLDSTNQTAQAPTPIAESLPATLVAKQEQLMRGETLREALSQGTDLPENAGAMLVDVVQALPSNVWLTELQVLGEKSLLISGGTLARPDLATFATRLQASVALSGTRIGVLQLTPRAKLEEAQGSGMGTDMGGHETSTVQPTHYAFTLGTTLGQTPQGGHP